MFKLFRFNSFQFRSTALLRFIHVELEFDLIVTFFEIFIRFGLEDESFHSSGLDSDMLVVEFERNFHCSN